MKKALLIITIVIFALSCQKSQPDALVNPLTSQLAGSYTGIKKIINYTDKQGISQVFDYGATFGYSNYTLDGAGSFTLVENFAAGGSATFKGTYSITTSGGINNVSFIINGDSVVSTYQIITLANHSLILSQYQGLFFGIASSSAIGTNAVLHEEYTR